MKCIARKFILSQANKLLEAYKDGIDEAKSKVKTWTTRARSLADCLDSLLQKLEDGRIDEEEMKKAVEEVKQLVEKW